MQILLINSDVSVSKLMALCTREASIHLVEVSDISTLNDTVYDIVFIDEGSYHKGIVDKKMMNKTVLLTSLEDHLDGFDYIIKKPFLPSSVIEVIHNIKDIHCDTVEESPENSEDSIFPLSAEREDEVVDTKILDAEEVEKIKNLLEMDNEDEIEILPLSDDEIEAKKIEIIKKQLIDDGLEIVDEKEMIEALSIEEVAPIFDIANEVKSNEKVAAKSDIKIAAKQKKKKKKSLAFNEDELQQIEDAVQVAIGTLKRKKMKKLLKGKRVDITIQLKGKK